MLTGLFPEDMVTEWGDPATPAPPLYPEEEELVARAITKRRQEFAKGRECARAALARLGVPDVRLLSGPHREPVWPARVVGSITHTAGLCAVVVARAERYLSVGVDVEPAEPLRGDIAARICFSGEESDGFLTAEGSLVSRLVFSAKEAVYKCLFPLSRKFLGFEDVRVRLENGAFHALLKVDAGPLRAGDVLDGRWARTEGYLLTGVWICR